VVLRLLDARRYRARSAMVTPPALEALGPALDAAGVRTFLVRLEIVKAIVGIEFHHGCLAVGERGLEPSPDAVFAEARTDRVVVLEDLGDASNVGAIFRNALALHAGAVLLSPGTADPLYRKAIRVSAGAAVALPFARLPDWPRDLKRVRDAGYTLVALTPREDAVDIAAVAPDLPARLALLLGTEGRGLSAEALAAADLHVRIPMSPAMDSLNVATASAVALQMLRPR
jgi:tRNA G18 (ribose-2'-O)-methylase SpoU